VERYFLGLGQGLRVMENRSGSLSLVDEDFPGKVLEDLSGLAKRPEVVFAAVAFDGGYRSSDAGRTWQKVLDGDVRAFAVDPNDERVVYAGTGPVCLYRSEDSGASWEPIDSLLDAPDEVKQKWAPPPRYQGIMPAHVRDIFIHPDDSAIIFVVLEHGGLMRSLDRGKTWEDASAGIVYPDMHMLRNYPGSKESYFTSSARGFFRSDDCGRSWCRTEDGMPWAYTEDRCYSHDWLFRPGDPLRMLVAGAYGSPGFWHTPEQPDPQGVILISDDGGGHWRQSLGGLPERLPWMAWSLTPHPSDPNTVLAGMGNRSHGFGILTDEPGEGALYVSRDRGDSWEPLLPELPSVSAVWVAEV
jgi:hypothetical protein